MPFQKVGDENLDARVNVRLLSSEKSRLKEDAGLAGIGMSELIRRRYFGRPIVADVNMAMIKELRRLGGLVKSLHTESHGAYSHDTARSLKLLNEAIGRLTHDH